MYTKGELKDRSPDFEGMLYIEGRTESFCTVFPTHCQNAKEILKRKENTAELRRRWNAFEEGGLVGDLVGALEKIAIHSDDPDMTKLAKAAIAKAKGS